MRSAPTQAAEKEHTSHFLSHVAGLTWAFDEPSDQALAGVVFGNSEHYKRAGVTPRFNTLCYKCKDKTVADSFLDFAQIKIGGLPKELKVRIVKFKPLVDVINDQKAATPTKKGKGKKKAFAPAPASKWIATIENLPYLSAVVVDQSAQRLTELNTEANNNCFFRKVFYEFGFHNIHQDSATRADQYCPVVTVARFSEDMTIEEARSIAKTLTHKLLKENLKITAVKAWETAEYDPKMHFADCILSSDLLAEKLEDLSVQDATAAE